MTRKEAVLLVSRALAIIQMVTALLEITYLPEKLLSLHHYASRINEQVATAGDFYFWTYDRFGLAFYSLRIAALLVFAILLWNCQPWIQRLLLPKLETPGQPA